MSINSRFGALIVTMCSLLAKKDGLQLVITNTNLFRVAEEMMRFEDRSSELRQTIKDSYSREGHRENKFSVMSLEGCRSSS